MNSLLVCAQYNQQDVIGDIDVRTDEFFGESKSYEQRVLQNLRNLNGNSTNTLNGL